jgi:hypothetical protein
LRDYQPESPAGRHAAALLIILVIASTRLGAGHAWCGLPLCGQPLLVLLILLVLRMACDL